MEIVETVAFILLRGNSVLVERRRMDKETDPGAVVIPGGHVEAGETHLDTLKRELHEELGVTCNDFKFIARMPCETETEIQMNHWYLCENWTGEPVSTEAAEVYFIDSVDELDLPNDKTVITHVFNSLLQ